MPRLNETTYIGVDPGKSGGMVALTGKSIASCVMPDTELDIWSWFAQFKNSFNVIGLIEKVSGYIGQKHPGSAMFNFGWGYGGLRMAMIGVGIPFDEVTPQNWQKAMGCLTKGDKLVSLRKAQQLYPYYPLWKTPKTIMKQKAIADALLIATFLQRKDQGRL